MKKNRWLYGGGAFLIGLILFLGLNWYYFTLPERVSQHETLILGQTEFVPGTEASIRVVVRDSRDGALLSDAEVEILLQPVDGGKAVTVFTGETDASGTTAVQFLLPNTTAAQTMIIKTKSKLGSDQLERTITLQRDYRLLVATDKPIYQPGQMIRVRLLALSTFDQKAAAQEQIEIVIEDAKGNTVFRTSKESSEFGVASVDFQLASEVNTGNFKITATIGQDHSEKTVRVEPYSLPKFDLSLKTEHNFYRPGDTVRGVLNADYFFGKPVADSNLQLEGFTFDFERQDIFTINGVTDSKGQFEFEFQLPEFIAGTDLDQGLGRFYLQAKVTDQAKQIESESLSLPIAGVPIIIEAVPEGGVFRPGIENIVYVLSSYPDGSPANTQVEVQFYGSGQTVSGESGRFGLTEIRLTPTQYDEGFSVEVRDDRGQSSQREFYFASSWQAEAVLVRADQPAYRVGDTMGLNIFTSGKAGTVYLDLVREGQTISTRAVKVEDGLAQVAVDLTPEMYGTLQINAYRIDYNGTISRDSRLVLVDEANELALSFATDQEIYRPGDQAAVNIQVNDAAGSGVKAAVGLAIVDESVFALAEQDAGFAKLYFILEEELLQPKYQLKGFSIPTLLEGMDGGEPILQDAQAKAASASLAGAGAQLPGFTLSANSRQENVAKVRERQDRYFSGLAKGSLLSISLLGVVSLLVLLYGLFKMNVLWPGLKRAGLLIGLAILILMSIGFLAENFYLYRYDEEIFVGIVTLSGLSFLTLLFLSWFRKNRTSGWLLGIIALAALFLGLAIFAADQVRSFDISEGWLLLLWLFFPLTWFLQAADFSLQRRWVGTVASFVLASVLFGFSVTAVFAFTGPMVVTEVMEGDMIFEMDGAMPPMAAEVEKERDQTVGNSAVASSSGGNQPRLRQYFPETMYWLPDGETDAAGNLILSIPVADSITTWRMTALASTQDGRLGSNSGSLRVFQQFFVDLNLPRNLTVGDEVSVPVGVFNYLAEPQTIQLSVKDQGWFTLLEPAEKQIEVAANEITVVYFRIRADQFGQFPFTVTAIGSSMSDAIQKEVRIYPNGKQFLGSESDILTAGELTEVKVDIPVDAIQGSQKVTVKIYPGLASQVVEGLDSILQMPSGCFEQTSSTTYPNVLVLDYLQTTDQLAPETQFKAEEYINLGYQRLTTFEIGKSGSFSLFGNPPPDPMLTAYGLQEFSDMSRVHEVDPKLINRIGEWLLSVQEADGSWASKPGFRESNLTNQVEALPVTAYVVWGLMDAGFVKDGRAQRGVTYLVSHQGESKDPYVLALVANGLVASDLAKGDGLSSNTQAVLDRLVEMATIDGESASWGANATTMMGSYGDTGAVEATALATLAFIRSGYRADMAQSGLNYLIQNKDSFGNWYTTQTTILSLKAFIEAARVASSNVDATVVVTLNSGETVTVKVNQENFDVVQQINFSDVALGENVVDIQVEGEGNLMYQVTSEFYLPWEKVAVYPELIAETAELVAIDVSYDRKNLAVDEDLLVNVSVKLNEPEGRADWAIVDLGIPPGFQVNQEDLKTLLTEFMAMEGVDQPSIEKYEITGRQLIIYIGNLTGERPLRFSYRMSALYPLRAQAPASSAYDYYNPAVSGEQAPIMVEVSE